MSNTSSAVLNPMGSYGKARQVMEETSLENSIRRAGSFPEVEAEMPILRSRRRGSIIDKISSLLGERNPWQKPINPREHTIWLFDNTAYRAPGATSSKNEWQAEVVAAYFVKESGEDSSEAVAKISELIGLAPDDASRKKVALRLQPFLDCVLPAHTAQLEIDNQTFKLGPSSSEGITTDIIKFNSKAKAGSAIAPQLVGMAPQVPMATYFAEPEGWAVISDVDDTIKKTMTSSALGVLQSTFVDDPEPIAGMPELYQHIQKSFKNPPFWYLTASPYNLYTFIREFKATFKFPPGQLILRDASWMSLAGLLASVTQGTQAYKVDRMKKIHSWFPKRKFICIGDSTQSDPEAYGEMYRANPEWVKAIFIRKVTGVDVPGSFDEDEKNLPARFEKAFKDVPAEIWYVFEDPKEVYGKLEELNNSSWKLW
ncbi:actin filament organization protein-like protein App1-like protein [Microthyrium microscopicum]|uniref:Actin filament organization protein-like protein App1-like protein n=1 Tax=Microthyrium microscopicum TaxID=703497 RepID=A0A6A6UQ73_9PEZI|nr:actin filament organization protein-like protein App1-like protein [Microthyrium microscopicum]